MTRKKQIKQAALERNYDCDFDSNDGLNGFIEGAQWADEHPKSPWINVEERLPEESKKYRCKFSDTVFVITNQGDGTSARYDTATKTWCPAKILRGRITHWMSIPNLKKVSQYGKYCKNVC